MRSLTPPHTHKGGYIATPPHLPRIETNGHMALEQTHTLKVQQPDDCLGRITEQEDRSGEQGAGSWDEAAIMFDKANPRSLVRVAYTPRCLMTVAKLSGFLKLSSFVCKSGRM